MKWFKLEHEDIPMIQAIVIVEVIVLMLVGTIMSLEPVKSTTPNEVIEMIEGVKLSTPTLSIPKCEKAPSQLEKPTPKTRKNSPRVYPVSRDLIKVLCKVESDNNPNAIGDNGRAYGMLQIHKVYVTDVNHIFGTTYSHRDMFIPEKAEDVCTKYLGYYAYKYWKLNKKVPSEENIVKMHNGGPLGYKNPNTDKYWNKYCVVSNVPRKNQD